MHPRGLRGALAKVFVARLASPWRAAGIVLPEDGPACRIPDKCAHKPAVAPRVMVHSVRAFGAEVGSGFPLAWPPRWHSVAKCPRSVAS